MTCATSLSSFTFLLRKTYYLCNFIGSQAYSFYVIQCFIRIYIIRANNSVYADIMRSTRMPKQILSINIQKNKLLILFLYFINVIIYITFTYCMYLYDCRY